VLSGLETKLFAQRIGHVERDRDRVARLALDLRDLEAVELAQCGLK